MKYLFLIVSVCMISLLVSLATDLRNINDCSASKEIQLQSRESGEVKWYDEKKRMGYITPDDGRSDIIVLSDDVVKAGLISLKAGQRILYNSFKEKKRTRAINLELPD
jgi:cold shock CspA family protein